ncbi:chromosomal replication initiator protein DnaA [Candidatus Saccharibacteria bacterium]|nr:MAG: chromosomal replication initiator protein DnaA [Candidatus Saccharibacteria bacterium]
MHDTLWQSVLAEIELSVSHGNFTTWFKPTQLIENTGDSVTIAVPNIFVKRQFEVKFDSQVRSVLAKNGVTPSHIHYKVNSSGVSKRRASREISLDELPPQPTDAAAPVASASTSLRPQSTLNPRYTFDSFIVGSCNDLAYTACRAAAEHPGEKYNPLFIYGGVGLGKTHLLQAVGNEIVKHSPKKTVLYVSSETFVKEFLDHIRFKKAGFSDKYRNVDVLIIDDMQFIAGKEKTQEEFFHTFNALHQDNKQIVIGSDKPPRSIPTLTERLRSRLEWGMAIDIQLPDFETRCAILEIKASQSDVALERDTIEYLASNIKTNIRELEGALNHLLAYAEMRNITPDISTAEGLLGDVRRSRPQHITPKNIIDRTARHFQVDTRELCSPRRDKHIALPRQIAMYLLRSELHMSFPRIASELGRKDHTTAIHSVHKIEKSIKLDYIIREQVAEIREKLYA